ncbi:7112_t:CDS:2 [Paraglomus occultum]|uniref:7112_t:CDS:1 n=1 Tax=Paraglomus occultum TaxID=144539 RepID=A0A9N8WN98_9GLOM|nr:7112_t:CDS:2 [Paraglomus occultum]
MATSEGLLQFPFSTSVFTAMMNELYVAGHSSMQIIFRPNLQFIFGDFAETSIQLQPDGIKEEIYESMKELKQLLDKFQGHNLDIYDESKLISEQTTWTASHQHASETSSVRHQPSPQCTVFLQKEYKPSKTSLLRSQHLGQRDDSFGLYSPYNDRPLSLSLEEPVKYQFDMNSKDSQEMIYEQVQQPEFIPGRLFGSEIVYKQSPEISSHPRDMFDEPQDMIDEPQETIYEQLQQPYSKYNSSVAERGWQKDETPRDNWFPQDQSRPPPPRYTEDIPGLCRRALSKDQYRELCTYLRAVLKEPNNSRPKTPEVVSQDQFVINFVDEYQKYNDFNTSRCKKLRTLHRLGGYIHAFRRIDDHIPVQELSKVLGDSEVAIKDTIKRASWMFELFRRLGKLALTNIKKNSLKFIDRKRTKQSEFEAVLTYVDGVLDNVYALPNNQTKNQR